MKRRPKDEPLVLPDVSIGPRAQPPGFVVLSPRKGVLLLEVKDFKRKILVADARDACALDAPAIQHHRHRFMTTPHPARERWTTVAADTATATLVIPADARRERRFEIACAMTVALRDTVPGAWHQMTVLANGAQQWQRREPTHNPGAFDGLDYRFSRTVPVGQPLRVQVSVAIQGARRRSLIIEADEQL